MDFKEIVQKMADDMLAELTCLKLDYGLLVVAFYDKENSKLKTTAIATSEDIKVPWAMEIALTKEEATEQSLDEVAELAVDKSTVQRFFRTPIYYQEEVRGIVITGKKNGAEMGKEETSMVRSFANMLGLAVQNSLTDVSQRLEELDRLKSEFVSVASHELRTPMTAIKSYLWMALAGKGGEISDKQRYYLERAYVSTDRLIKLVNDLLNVSRIESGKLSMDRQKMELQKFVDEVIAEVKPRADEMGIKINNQFDTQHPVPEVLGDSDKLKEVMINLIGNSLKFTPKNGEIDISFKENGDFVTVGVKDNGEGIAPEDLPKLFQKFGLVKESYVTNQKASQGTGLGLYISKSIVELHGGKMWAESGGHGLGATFNFSLPIFTEEKFAEAQKNKGTEGLGIIHSTID